MKITIPKQDFLDTVNRVKSVVALKSAIPILTHLLFETTNAAIRIVGTDLKVSIESNVDCLVDAPGSMTLNAQRISSILNELPDQDIVLELLENNIVKLTCGKIESRLFSLSPDEYPPLRSFDEIVPLSLKQGILKKLFYWTSHAICTDQARYNLTGLLFELAEGKLTVVSTDGRRMSLGRELEGIPDTALAKVIIPSKMVHEMERQLDDEELIDIYIDQSQAAFVFGNTRMITALIEGNFPNYDMVIPKTHDKEALIDKAVFAEAIRRTRTMTNDKFNTVRLAISPEKLVLKVVTPDVGEYVEEMPIEYNGEKVEIAFNPDFVWEVVRRIDSEKVVLVLKDGQCPGVIKPYTESPEDLFVNVIMPIRT